MRCPTVKSLLAAFPHLTRADALKIRKLAKSAPDGRVLQFYIPPGNRTSDALSAIDKVFCTYGVERLDDNHEFMNTGETYDTTLIYKHSTDNLFIGCWGDMVERGRIKS